MIFTNDREKFRQAFFTAWEKHLKRLPVEGIEAQLIEVILAHPEYQPLLEKATEPVAMEYKLEKNPFLHMSLHLAIREQLQVNKPNGITRIQQRLLSKHQNNHHVEHCMMDCLAELLWTAQQNGIPPNELEYLEKLQQL